MLRAAQARFDASYPGIPPGIPLLPLFGNWMAGICLIQQALGMLLALALAWIWQMVDVRGGRRRLLARALVFAIIPIGTAVAGYVFFFSVTTPRMAGLFLIGLTLLSVALLEGIWRMLRSAKQLSVSPGLSDTDMASGGTMLADKSSAGSIRWGHGTTARMLIFIVLPYLVLLYTRRVELSGLHPVAILLTSLTGAPRGSGARDAVELALMAGALPLFLPLASALRALYRGASPVAGAVLGLRHVALTCLVCLVAAYAVLLNQMLILDAEASQAIQKAAENDRQWVLTHGADSPF